MTPILGIWASAAQGAANAGSFESIATVTVGSGGSSSITFSSIPATYTHLQIRAIQFNSSGGSYDTLYRFNSDSGNNYISHYLEGTGSSVGAGVAYSSGATNYGSIGSNFYTTTPDVFVWDILDYANTNKYKTSRSLDGRDNNGAGNIKLASSLWMSTSAITSIVISNQSGNFAQYSHFALYGIKSA